MQSYVLNFFTQYLKNMSLKICGIPDNGDVASLLVSLPRGSQPC